MIYNFIAFSLLAAETIYKFIIAFFGREREREWERVLHSKHFNVCMNYNCNTHSREVCFMSFLDYHLK